MDSLAKIAAEEDQNDAVMKLNPTLYKVVSEGKPDHMQDAFATILKQQGRRMDRSGFVSDAVNRAELDHPHSLHNAATGQGEQQLVRFPESSNDPANQNDFLQLGGYYDREALSLQGGFQPPGGPINVDTRMMTGAKLGSNLQDKNQIYQPNAELLSEIARNKANAANVRAYRKPSVHQQVEEISPSGVKRELHPIVDDQSSVARNPFAVDEAGQQMVEDSQLGASVPRNMFHPGLDASQETGMLAMSAGDCRRDLPDRP
jgi:hypothetical protein